MSPRDSLDHSDPPRRRQLRRRLTSAAVATVLAAAVAPTLAAGPALADGIVPYQYISKLYTEALGRLPDAGGWASKSAAFAAAGCDAGSVQRLGNEILQSNELASRNYDNAAKVLVAYRTVLDREPDQAGFDGYVNQLNNGGSFTDVVNTLYSSGEFNDLVGRICDSGSSDYDFGATPAINLPTNGDGFTGDQGQLQSTLDNTPAGGTVALAQEAIVRLNGTLRIPDGVTLTTTGTPGPDHYASMGRLVRASAFDGEMVAVQSGAHLASVWVDGQNSVLGAYAGPRINVRMRGGTGNTVANNRLGNASGPTNLEAYGSRDGGCASNVISGNLIEAYSSDHYNTHWTDGASVHCEDTLVENNQVADATDVSIVIFALTAGTAQHSQVHGNAAISSGNAAYGAYVADPYRTDGSNNPPNQANRSFVGASIDHNTFWTGARTHIDVGLSAGTREWFGDDTQTGTGVAITNNSTGGQQATVGTGIIVSGMLNVNVTGNDLNVQVVDTGDKCPGNNIAAAISAGYASGDIQGPFADTFYNRCIGH